MSTSPGIESVCEHGGGDWARVAAWLIDCLDRELPQIGGYLTLYLCYHSNDRSYFSSSKRNSDLVKAMLDVYQAELAISQEEAQWSGPGFGTLRFHLETAQQTHAHLSLIRQGADSETKKSARESEVELSHEKRAGSVAPTPIEFHWEEANGQVAPGTLGLVRRWTTPLNPQTRLVAALTLESDTAFATHLERWQGNIRWHRPVIYLPEGRTELFFGSTVGCDLYTTEFLLPLGISYESGTDEWTWASPAAPWMPEGNQRGALSLSYGEQPDKPLLKLCGARLPGARTLHEQEAENRLPAFSLEIVGCVLPLPHADGGYGVIPENLPSTLVSRASSALQLPGGDWLYLDERREPYVLRTSDFPPGIQLLRDGQQTKLTTRTGNATPQAGSWHNYKGTLRNFFRGEIRIIPPLIAHLAADAIEEDLPHDVFRGYKDGVLGRAPVRLESPDGRRYSLVFNELAQHPVFVLARDEAKGKRFNPSPAAVIELGAGADFILGTTHYRLLPATDSGTDYQLILPSSLSLGGIL